MKIVLVLACIVAITSAIPVFNSADPFNSDNVPKSLFARLYEGEFQKFVLRFNKSYTGDEKVLRFRIFADNLDLIEKWNLFNRSSGVTLGINEFSDLTHAEFTRFYYGYKPPPTVDEQKACSCGRYVDDAKAGAVGYCEDFTTQTCAPYPNPHNMFGSCTGARYCTAGAGPSPPSPPSPPTPTPNPPSPTPPTPGPAPASGSIDWVSKGAVTPVKNQAQCGSCWAFSTTGSLEGAIFVKHGVLDSLSEEELVQCDKKDQGCNGGQMEDGFSFVKKNKGIATEQHYPYTKKTAGGTTGKCVTADERPIAKYSNTVTGFTKVKKRSEVALKTALKIGPVSVAVNAMGQIFQHYKSGVIKSSHCSGMPLDHGVLAVGFGVEDGTKYFKIKNSWGPHWGEHGYLKVENTDSSDSTGTCGVALDASYPTLA